MRAPPAARGPGLQGQSSTAGRRPSGGQGGARAPAAAERQRNAGFFAGAKQPDGCVQQAGLLAALRRAAETAQLNLADRGLEVLPEEVCNFAELQIEGCNWWEQCSITKLDVSNNSLTSLPKEIEKLVDCSVILASGNRLAEVPVELVSLPLKALHLGSNALCQVPDGIAACSSLVELVLSGNRLQTLPQDIARMANLEVLDVCKNQLRALPPLPPRLLRLKAGENSLSALAKMELPRLQELDVSKNKISRLDAHALASLHKLVTLKLDENALSQLPSFPADASLDCLSAAFNALVELPPSLCGCSRLSVVLVHNNQLQALPEGMADLRCLNTLDVSNNNLGQLPLGLGLLPALKRINVQGNPLKSLPPQVLRGGTEALKRCLRDRLPEDLKAQASAAQEDSLAMAVRAASANRKLLLSNLGLAQLPDGLELPEGLEVLNLSQNSLCDLRLLDLRLAAETLLELHLDGNKLQALPQGLAELSRLRHLSASRNALSGLPPSCSGWRDLKFADFSTNQLAAIPPALALGCPALVELRLNSNRIKSVQPFGSRGTGSRGLCTLDLEGNQLTSVPSSLVECLPSLNTLLLANNSLLGLPPRFGDWSSLRSVSLHGNPWREIRIGLVQKGWPAVRDFLRTRVQADEADAADDFHSGPGPGDSHQFPASRPSSSSAAAGADDSGPARHPRLQQVEALRQEVAAMQDQLQNPTALSQPQIYALRKVMQKKNAERIRLEREIQAELDGAVAAS
mmetsp:Transcript_62291/g.148712  ORF Transcript_62291/g.148712 Transcript_62291/m.148712 type:complete len:745 (+) Transcript_62291:101-2335(+)